MKENNNNNNNVFAVFYHNQENKKDIDLRFFNLFCFIKKEKSLYGCICFLNSLKTPVINCILYAIKLKTIKLGIPFVVVVISIRKKCLNKIC